MGVPAIQESSLAAYQRSWLVCLPFLYNVNTSMDRLRISTAKGAMAVEWIHPD